MWEASVLLEIVGMIQEVSDTGSLLECVHLSVRLQ